MPKVTRAAFIQRQASRGSALVAPTRSASPDYNPSDFSHKCNPTCAPKGAYHRCAVCGKGTKQACNIKTHELIHTDITFKCDYYEAGCQFRWRDPAKLTKHIQNVHDGIRIPRTYTGSSARVSKAAPARFVHERASSVVSTTSTSSESQSSFSSAYSSRAASPYGSDHCFSQLADAGFPSAASSSGGDAMTHAFEDLSFYDRTPTAATFGDRCIPLGQPAEDTFTDTLYMPWSMFEARGHANPTSFFNDN